MITKEEFLKALQIVNNYKTQVSVQLEEIKKIKKDLDKNSFSHLSITKDTLIKDTGISVRAQNVLRAVDGFNNKILTVGCFEGLKKSDLYVFRNTGKKTIDEIERAFFEAGIIL